MSSFIFLYTVSQTFFALAEESAGHLWAWNPYSPSPGEKDVNYSVSKTIISSGSPSADAYDAVMMTPWKQDEKSCSIQSGSPRSIKSYQAHSAKSNPSPSRALLLTPAHSSRTKSSSLTPPRLYPALPVPLALSHSPLTMREYARLIPQGMYACMDCVICPTNPTTHHFKTYIRLISNHQKIYESQWYHTKRFNTSRTNDCCWNV